MLFFQLKMHQMYFGGRALPGPAGTAYMLPGFLQGEHKSTMTFDDISAMRENFCMQFFTAITYTETRNTHGVGAYASNLFPGCAATSIKCIPEIRP